jgi:hypothetical protein
MQRLGRFKMLLGALPLLLCGCDEWCESDCEDFWEGDHRAPNVPVGVYSVTGDGEVFLYWIENQEDDLDGYRIYVSPRPEGPYELIGETRFNHFTDSEARNGRTYYYAVTAFDFDENESDLSYETVRDTPRPEGFGLVLTSASGSSPWDAGYDFSGSSRVHPESPEADVFFDSSGPTTCIHAASSAVGLQDLGYEPLSAIDRAPEGGWVLSGRVEATVGHSYAIRTRDGYFAKCYVVSVAPSRVVLDWAFQTDRGNRELSETPAVSGGEGPAASSTRSSPGPISETSL